MRTARRPAPRAQRRAAAPARHADLAAVLVLALAAGAAPLLGASPLHVAAAVAAGAAGLQLLRRADTAVCIAVATVLLPTGLLPGQLQSGLELVTIVLAALATLAARRVRVEEPTGPPLPLAVYLLCGFVTWSLLSLMWSSNLDLGMDVVRRYALGLLLVTLVVVRITTRDSLDRLMGALAAVGWLTILCGVYAVLADRQRPDGRIAVLALHPNQLGNLLLLVSAAVIWRAVSPGYVTRARLVQAAAFMACAVNLISRTGSRGSLIALALLMLGLVVVRGLRGWAMVAVTITSVLLLVAPSTFGMALERFRYQDPEELSRTTLWLAGLDLVADHPFGVGPGESPYVLPDYVDQRTAQNHFEARDHVPAHNPLIEVADEAGAIGAALLGSVLVTAGAGLAVTTARARREEDAFWSAYGTVILICSAAYGLVWFKSGGMSYDFGTFVLLSLWLLAGRADGRAPAVSHRPVSHDGRTR